MYLHQVDKVEARKSVALLEAMSYPYMKKSDRRRVERKYEHILERDVKPSPKKAEAAWDYLRKRYREIVAMKREKENK